MKLRRFCHIAADLDGLPRRWRQAADNAKVNEANPAIRQDQQVACRLSQHDMVRDSQPTRWSDADR